MPSVSAESDLLSDLHYTVFVVRIQLATQGCVRRGELVDCNAQLLDRFEGKRGLLRLLDERLKDCDDHV